MARISTNRSFKLIMGIVMTFVLVVSLFAGIGAIWVREETHVASADTGMLDGEGKYVMPKGSAGSISDVTKGTTENPFTVLEIVPNANMAQFGYLVKGQEPIDLIEFALNSADYAANYAKLSEYLEMTRLDEDKAFNIFNEYLRDGESYDYIKTDGSAGTIEYGDSQLIWDRNAGKTTQYGEFVKDDNGDFAIVQTKVYEPSGYTIVPMSDNSDAVASINEDNLAADAIYEDTPAEAVAKLKEQNPGAEFSEIQSGNVYRYVPEGTGEFSSAKYVLANGAPFTENGGEYSLTHRKVTDGTGDIKVKEEEENYNYYTTANYLQRYGSSLWAMHGNGSDNFAQYDTFVAFRHKNSSDVGKPTYKITYYSNNVWYDSSYNDRNTKYNMYYTIYPADEGDSDFYRDETVSVYEGNAKTIKDSNKLGNGEYVDDRLYKNITIGTRVYTRETEKEYLTSKPAGYDSAKVLQAYPNGRAYKYDDDRFYYYYKYSGTWYYDVYVYTYEEDVRSYYKFVYSPTASTIPDGDYYIVLFDYADDEEEGSGDFVVDESVSKTSYSDVDYGMSYTSHGNYSYSLGWSEVSVGTGSYKEISEGEFSIPQKVGTYKKLHGDKKTVGLGEYRREDLSAVQYIENGADGSIASKDRVRYAIVPVYSDTDSYKYRLVKHAGVEFGTDVTLIAKYAWVGDKVVRKSTELTTEFINEHQLPEHLRSDASAVAKKYEDESTIPDSIKGVYPEERSFSKGFVGTFKSKDLFKKNSVGLAYKDNDFTKDKDIDTFSFIGWYTDPNGVNQFADSTKITADTTIYAKWLVKYPDDTAAGWNGYTVTFDPNVGAEDPDKDTVANMPGDSEHHQITGFNRNALISEPESIPIRKDYLFEGWYTAADNSGTRFDFANTRLTDSIMGTTTNDAGATVSDNNLTLYAHWTKIEGAPATYSFEFNPNTALLPSTVVVRRGDAEYLNISVANVAANGRRYYTKEVEGVTTAVSFEEVDLSAFAPAAIKKTNGADAGYIFGGWYIDRECREKFTFDAAGMKRIREAQAAPEGEPERTNFVLYANWVNGVSLPKYNVTFNLNKPSAAVANAELSRRDLTATTANVYRLMGLDYDTVIEDFDELIPTLEGNVEAKLANYVVNVVTVTPADLANPDKKAFDLIGRADLIVLNETCETEISGLWDKYKKYTTLSSLADVTSFAQNDIGWDATVEILSRITGFKYDETRKRSVAVETCPVLFDYNIFYNCINSDDSNVTKEVSFTSKDKNKDSISVSDIKSCSANVYKLYLMTQVSSPVTVYNAFFTGRLDKKIEKKSGTNTGAIVSKDSSKFSFNTSTDADTFWSGYTFIPYNVISADEWDEDARPNTLKLLGFNSNYRMDTIAGTSSIKNRMFIFNNRETGTLKSINLVSGYNNTIKMDETSFNDVKALIGAPRESSDYEVSDIFYFMLHGTTMYENLERDINVLEIQPGTGAHSDEYWFWYISHYAPNVTGTITGNAMSSLEFQCNIEDLNSTYDVIFMGTDKTRHTLTGDVDSSSLENIEPESSYTYEELVPDHKGNIKGELLNQIKADIGNRHIAPTSLLKSSYTVGGKTYTRGASTYYSDRDRDFIGTNIGTPIDDSEGTYSYRYTEDYIYVRVCTSESWWWWGPDYEIYRIPFYTDKLVTVTADTHYAYYHTGKIGRTSQYAIGAFNTLNVAGDGSLTPKLLNPSTTPVYGNYLDILSQHLKNNCANNKGPDTALTSYTDDTTGITYYRGGEETSNASQFNDAPTNITSITDAKNSYSYKRDSKYVYVRRRGNNNYHYSKYQYYVPQETGGYNDDLTTTAAFSGNDFTFAKYKAVAEFLKAGYPIIFDDGFFKNDGNINTGLIDTSSWIYKLLNELKTESPNRERYNWFRINTTNKSDQEAFLRALMNKTFTLVVDSKPIEYKDRTLSIFSGKTDAQIDKLIYINGEDHNNRNLEFEIKINELVSGGKYRLKLFIDTNADGRYSTETERIDTVTVYDTVAKRSYNADTTSLVAGRTYKVSRTLPDDQTGVLAWKLQLTALNGGAETTIRDEVTGLSAIKVETRTKINVLQITSTASGENVKFNYKTKTGANAQMEGIRGTTSIYLPTDEEIKNGALVVPAGQPSKTYMSTNWSKFRQYTKDLDEFEVHFFRINAAELAEVATNSNKVLGQSYKVIPNGSSYKFDNTATPEDITWEDINMLVIGFGFGYSDITDAASRELIQDFIESGKTVLFTNDTIKDEFMSTKETFNYVYNHEYYNAASGSNLSSSYAGYNLTKSFRNMIGQDRFGAFVNYGFFNDSAVPNNLKTVSAVKSVTKQVNDTLGVSFGDIKIQNASSYSLDYDLPFVAGQSMSIANIDNLANTSKVVVSGLRSVNGYYELNGSASSSDKRVLVQGLSKNALKTGAFTPVYEATKTNDGQIVSYPYSIGKVTANGANTYIDTALTRSQYMQLNMEDDDIVVWFSLYKKGVDGGDVSGSTINDGTNNYYIYSKGNITYTGVGFNFGTLEEDEYKLFVNTMIAAYRSGVNATRPIITNPDKSSENDKDYLYIDYDATLSEDSKAAPIGDDEDITTLKDSSGNEIRINPDTGEIATEANGGKPVYCKRVRFTLRNDSIVLNKLMTVHYYPCVMVGNVRVTLYDYPMELATYRVSTEDGETDKNIKDIQTSAAFKYSVPDGVTQNAAVMNKMTNINVAAGRGLVSSLSEYYVDVPISENYYKNLIWKKNGVNVASNINYTYYISGDDTAKTVVIAPTTFGLDNKNSFETEIQVVMRYGRNPDMNAPLVGTRGVVFMRRGMFTLD